MAALRLGVGDIVRSLQYESPSGTWVVWEITADYTAIIPTETEALEITPIYIANSRLDQDLQVIAKCDDALRIMHWIPDGALFAMVTWPPPRPGFDLAELIIVCRQDETFLELRETRITGVLGNSDGTFCSHHSLDENELTAVRDEIERIGYWDLDVRDKRQSPESDGFWLLSVYDGIRRHSVSRHSVPNEIQSACALCDGLVEFEQLRPGSVLQEAE